MAPAAPAPRRRLRTTPALAVVVLLALGFAVWWSGQRPAYTGRITAIGADLSQPVAYVGSPALSALPRDLVRAPLLRDLLTEDFAFHYEAHEDLLTLRGAIRRLAYEHELQLGDELLALALDAEAEIAFWPDARGAPRHWAMAMSRGPLARTLQGLASLAASDAQLRELGRLRLPGLGRTPVTVLALSLSSRRTLALATRGERVVVFSDPGLLFAGEGRPAGPAVEVLAKLLSDRAEDHTVWRRHFGLNSMPDTHRLVAGSGVLAHGWQAFFPGLQAFRVDVAREGASLRTALRRAVPPAEAAPPWAAVPAGAAACAALPVDWPRAGRVLAALPAAEPEAAASTAGAASAAFAADYPWAQAAEGPVAVCWYGRAALHTPLLAARARGPVPSPEVLAAFLRSWMPQGVALDSSDAGQAQAQVPGPWAPDAVDAGDNDGGPGIYRPTLQRLGDWWLFSPDAALVARAADAVQRRYPSVADTLAAGAAVPLAVISPAELALLARRETLAIVGPQQPVFRQAAETLLWPRLDALARWPAMQVAPEGVAGTDGWQALDWRPMTAVRP